ncbi:MAG: hypothetical protein UU08_C0010G0001 [Candidatus Uhrbacteria bacterium GW2011_GWE2_40_58]|nr:MAG: hypothetical protein UU08_C0010G0001 [Candidatus Uhrbacteria bacterium GW2011_GWE2_40_58]OGL94408.1 MAG: hypothetical protein A2239_01020 [Candidatus Uhrbacteria bacterium RIFOXYA2_FULL_40_9]OGL96644.1 MAG: hypothetical protein A2332_02740 [Candidatus Uhrbacteria bacterium RIFOXYB2_FULL_41_18]HBK34794.1 hypothetical protein [Candidatus Uhrbacteria bacterium]HCB56202.1 hypothetical protein [Candidatus Uhrbacteria bacterium]
MLISYIKRKPLRLPYWNYSNYGSYFVTLCVHNWKHLFGNVLGQKIILNDVGRMTQHWWNEIPKTFPNIDLDSFIIMPNHIHGIIHIKNVEQPPCGLPVPQCNVVPVPQCAITSASQYDVVPVPQYDMVPAGHRGPALRPALGDIVGWFKSIVVNTYGNYVKKNQWQPYENHLWQYRYYDHVIRNENDLLRIKQYILDNPYRWRNDRFYQPKTDGA